jgi:hypothetical protein
MDQSELMAPIANLDMDDLLDFIIDDKQAVTNDQAVRSTHNNHDEFDEDDEDYGEEMPPNEKRKNLSKNKSKSNSDLSDPVDLCNSLEDLVKTFDKNVKECFTKYKNIDVGQLAPVQVRSQNDIINDSQ